MPSKNSEMLLTNEELALFNEDQDVSLNRAALEGLGGLHSLQEKLRTNFATGLTGDAEDLAQRRERYGPNAFPEPERSTWLGLFLESFEDTTLIVLIVAAVVSLAVGMYEDPASGWIEGAAILTSVVVVSAVTATNNYNKESQFRRLNAVKVRGTGEKLGSATGRRHSCTHTYRQDDVEVGVVRNGVATVVNVKVRAWPHPLRSPRTHAHTPPPLTAATPLCRRCVWATSCGSTPATACPATACSWRARTLRATSPPSPASPTTR